MIAIPAGRRRAALLAVAVAVAVAVAAAVMVLAALRPTGTANLEPAVAPPASASPATPDPEKVLAPCGRRVPC
jgi:hypothetical protein